MDHLDGMLQVEQDVRYSNVPTTFHSPTPSSPQSQSPLSTSKFTSTSTSSTSTSSSTSLATPTSLPYHQTSHYEDNQAGDGELHVHANLHLLQMQHEQTLDELESLPKGAKTLRDQLLASESERNEYELLTQTAKEEEQPENWQQHGQQCSAGPIAGVSRPSTSLTTKRIQSAEQREASPRLDTFSSSPLLAQSSEVGDIPLSTPSINLTNTTYSSSYFPAPSTMPGQPRRKPHNRTLSAATPFMPSPLRNASFPPYPAHSHHDVQATSTSPSQYRQNISSHLAGPSAANNISRTGNDNDTINVLIARLRQERDDALNRIAFLTLEHETASRTLLDEIDDLRTGRDALRRDLKDMVSKMMDHEQSQSTLSAMTDSLCESEARERQVNGRLKSALAELDVLRKEQQHLRHANDSDTPPVTDEIHANNASSTELQSEMGSTDSNSTHAQQIHEMMSTAARLEDELEAAHTKELGSANLVLLLQKSLDEANDALMQTRGELEESQRELCESRNDSVKSKEGHQVQIHSLEMELDAAREACSRAHLEWEGSANLALSLQQQLNNSLASTRLVRCEAALDRERIMHLEALRDTQRAELETLTSDLRTSRKSRNCLEASFKSLLVHFLLFRRTTLQRANQERQTLTASLTSARPNDHSSILAMACMYQHMHRASSMYKNQQDKWRQEVERSKKLESELDSLKDSKAEEQATLQLQFSDRLAHLQQESALLSGERTELLDRCQQLESDLVQTHKALSATHNALNLREHEVADLRTEYRKLQGEVDAVRQSLHNAEEEGRHLVTDFNMLSEELEEKQKEEDARSRQIRELQHKLDEALAKHGTADSGAISNDSAVLEMKDRLADLEAMLQNMQTDVEETDDKYLASLKKIKAQTQLIDKLKLRVDSLTRLNATLEQAAKTTAHHNRTDQLSSSPGTRKRVLPEDFVSPDPGPAAVIQAPGGTSLLAEPTVMMITSPSRAATPQTTDACAPISSAPVQVVTHPARTGRDLKITSLPQEGLRKRPSGTAQRRPLAPLPAQNIRTQQEQHNVKTLRLDGAPDRIDRSTQQLPSKSQGTTHSLSSRHALRQDSRQRTVSAGQTSAKTDTKSLLAALQALKQPSRA